MGSSAGVAESRVRHSQVVRMIRGIGSLIFVRAGRTKDQESACTIDFGMVHDSRCCRYVEVDVMTPRAQMDTRGARSSPLESIVVYISHQLLRLSGPQVPSGSRTYKKQKSSCRIHLTGSPAQYQPFKIFVPPLARRSGNSTTSRFHDFLPRSLPSINQAFLSLRLMCTIARWHNPVFGSKQVPPCTRRSFSPDQPLT